MPDPQVESAGEHVVGWEWLVRRPLSKAGAALRSGIWADWGTDPEVDIPEFAGGAAVSGEFTSAAKLGAETMSISADAESAADSLSMIDPSMN